MRLAGRNVKIPATRNHNEMLFDTAYFPLANLFMRNAIMRNAIEPTNSAKDTRYKI
jgi:hypothetical protein